SVVGPMGRNVADTLLQLRASAGLAQSDPLSYAIADDEFAGKKSVPSNRCSSPATPST
ncbi:amidase family protein, partial [Pseudomonas syringae pv. actinidiae ICMP 19079]